MSETFRDALHGRPVQFPLSVQRKVRMMHFDIAYLGASEVLAAVAQADLIRPDRKHRNRDVYFRRGVGPSSWLCVVVEYDCHQQGSVVTAFARRRLPGWV
jgi:hypothetical protein